MPLDDMARMVGAAALIIALAVAGLRYHDRNSLPPERLFRVSIIGYLIGAFGLALLACGSYWIGVLCLTALLFVVALGSTVGANQLHPTQSAGEVRDALRQAQRDLPREHWQAVAARRLPELPLRQQPWRYTATGTAQDVIALLDEYQWQGLVAEPGVFILDEMGRWLIVTRTGNDEYAWVLTPPWPT
jgi:hypothetical protein